METLIVERIEEGTVIFEKENGTYLKVTADELPFGVCEGDVVGYDGNIFLKNVEETLERKRKLLLMQKKLSEKNKNK